MAKIDKLFANIDVPNLAEGLDAQVIAKIASRCAQGYEADIASRYDWEKLQEAGMKVAKQVAEGKSFPWAGAANIRYPLIASASIQFAARAMPQLVAGPDIVRVQVNGSDPQGQKEDRAKRISQHMSWQLLQQDENWEADMDSLLHGLPCFGTMFKKTYFDPLLQRNRSIVLNPLDLVVNMKHKGGLDTCRRISHKIMLYRNEVLERENAGLFLEGSADLMILSSEVDEQELFIEQHCWYDLDEDGYSEPYIVTFHQSSGKACRVAANYDYESVSLNAKQTKIISIKPTQYFTKFTFIPSPDGDFYDIGFSQLLGPINAAMSTLINQLLDAGSLSNTGGGFISKGLRWSGGRLTFELGEWKPVDTVGMSLKDSILPLPVKEPSGVLFNLLGLLNEQGNKLAAVSDAMSGETPSQNTPATTTLATIEQGLKVFTGIYKRVYRALKQEYKKLYLLNGKFLPETEYFRLLDEPKVAYQQDYAVDDLDIAPVADPTMSSEAQRLARAQALLSTMEMNPDPMGRIEILAQYYDAIGAKNKEQLLNVEQLKADMSKEQPPPPEMLKFQLDTQKASDEHDLALKDQEIKENEAIARIQLIEMQTDLAKAQTFKAMAEAEAVEPGQQLQQYKQFADNIAADRQHERELKKLGIEQDEKESKETEGAENGQTGASVPPTEGTDTGMVEPSGDGQGVPPMQPTPEILGGAAPVGVNIESELSGSNGDADYAQLGADIRSASNNGASGL